MLEQRQLESTFPTHPQSVVESVLHISAFCTKFLENVSRKFTAYFPHLYRILYHHANVLSKLHSKEKPHLVTTDFDVDCVLFTHQTEAYTDSGAILAAGYEDKAAERRRTKGSDHPHQKDDESASVDR